MIPLKNRINLAILRFFKPFSKWIGDKYAPYSIKFVPKTWYQWLAYLEPMDMIITYTKGYYANPFIPSKEWKHSLIYVGIENNIPMCVEALTTGVTKRPLLDSISEKDSMCILRCTSENKNIYAGLKFIDNVLNKPYDFNFDMITIKQLEAFYCSELSYHIWLKTFPDCGIEKSSLFGLPTIFPDDFYHLAQTTDKINIIYEVKS